MNRNVCVRVMKYNNDFYVFVIDASMITVSRKDNFG